MSEIVKYQANAAVGSAGTIKELLSQNRDRLATVMAKHADPDRLMAAVTRLTSWGGPGRQAIEVSYAQLVPEHQLKLRNRYLELYGVDIWEVLEGRQGFGR